MTGARAFISGIIVLMSATAGHGQTAPAAPARAAASVEQLAWIAGAWNGTLGDRIIEQHWSKPLAGSIVAMYRSVQQDKVTLYELLAIEQEGTGVVLRIKHFAPGAGLAGREAKDQSIDHELISLEGRAAVFQGVDPASPTRVTFRSPDANTLNITVERTRDGKTVATEFRYSRIAP